MASSSVGVKSTLMGPMSRRKGETYYKSKLAWDYVKRFENPKFSRGEPPIVNGHELSALSQNNIRQWEKGNAVSLPTLDRVLVECGLTLTSFEMWANAQDPDYILE